MDIRYESITKYKLARFEYSKDIISWLMDAGNMNNYYTYDVTGMDLPFKPYKFPLWDNKVLALVVSEKVFSFVYVSSARCSRVKWLEMIDNQTYVNEDDTREVDFLVTGNTLTVMQIYYVDGKSNKSTTGLLELSDALSIANEAYVKYLQEQVKEEI